MGYRKTTARLLATCLVTSLIFSGQTPLAADPPAEPASAPVDATFREIARVVEQAAFLNSKLGQGKVCNTPMPATAFASPMAAPMSRPSLGINRGGGNMSPMPGAPGSGANKSQCTLAAAAKAALAAATGSCDSIDKVENYQGGPDECGAQHTSGQGPTAPYSQPNHAYTLNGDRVDVKKETDCSGVPSRSFAIAGAMPEGVPMAGKSPTSGEWVEIAKNGKCVDKEASIEKGVVNGDVFCYPPEDGQGHCVQACGGPTEPSTDLKKFVVCESGGSAKAWTMHSCERLADPKLVKASIIRMLPKDKHPECWEEPKKIEGFNLGNSCKSLGTSPDISKFIGM